MMPTTQVIITITLVISMASSQLIYHVQEEGRVGEVVGYVKRDAGLQGQYSKKVFDKLTFSFLTDLSWLSVHPTSAVISTSARVDREAICGQSFHTLHQPKQQSIYSHHQPKHHFYHPSHPPQSRLPSLHTHKRRAQKEYVDKIKMNSYKNNKKYNTHLHHNLYKKHYNDLHNKDHHANHSLHYNNHKNNYYNDHHNIDHIDSHYSDSHHSDNNHSDHLQQNVSVATSQNSAVCSIFVDIALSPFEHFSLIR